MNFAKKALMTACLTLTAGTASAYEQLSPPSWGLDRIDQDGAVAGGDGKYQYDNEAAGMPVFMIDTGVDYNHPDFEGRATLWDLIDTSGSSGFTDCQLGSGSSVANHGTMVAGIVGSRTYGVAKKARLFVVRAIDCAGQSNATMLANAINYVVANGPLAPNGRRGVINLSLTLNGTASDIATLETAVTNAISAGFVVVAAAGNGNINACGNSPGRMPSVITVAASNRLDARLTATAPTATVPAQPTSAYGSCVKIWAPGGEVVGPRIGDFANANPMIWGGTSFATPHVSGAAAILLSKGIAPANVLTELQTQGTQNALNAASIGTGSPNTLLRSFRPPPPGCTLDRPLSGGAINVTNPAGDMCYFYLDVPGGKSSVTFKITGGTGDADMYVRFGNKPENYVYDCRPYRPGNEEICTMYLPTNTTWSAGGRWWVRLGGYNGGAYSTTVSGTVQ